MLALVIHKDADADLDELWETDEAAAEDLTVLIEEIHGSEQFLAAMQIHQATYGRVHVSRLFKFEVWGKSLWRLRICELHDPERLLAYRLIYACHGSLVHLLAVMHRDRDYENDAGLVARIRDACRKLGIPTHP